MASKVGSHESKYSEVQIKLIIQTDLACATNTCIAAKFSPSPLKVKTCLIAGTPSTTTSPLDIELY